MIGDKSSYRVLGLDLSITHTGIVAHTGVGLTVKHKAGRGDYRLIDIYETVRLVAANHDLAVIEDLPHSGRQAGVTGMVQGVVRMALIRAECPYALVSPASLKLFAAGHGKADKARMRDAWIGRGYHDRYPGVEVDDDNQVDAGWLMVAGYHKLGVDTTMGARIDGLKAKWEGWKWLM